MEPLNPNNTNLKSFDLKIKLLIAESVEDEKKKELEALNMKISQVDQLVSFRAVCIHKSLFVKPHFTDFGEATSSEASIWERR